MDPIDLHIRATAGPEQVYDGVVRDFLCNCRDELHGRLGPNSLLRATSLGDDVPWLWRLDYQTRGLMKDAASDIVPCDRHVVAVRFLPDYLRRANRFEMLLLLEPAQAFHPNLREGRICLEVYPGEPLVEICESLHALLGWRLRMLAETDALNPTACAWGRAHLDELPIDARPLFGRTLAITLEPVAEEA